MKSQMSLLLRLCGQFCLGLLVLLGLYLGLGMPARPAHAQSILAVTDCSNDYQLQAYVIQANIDNDGDSIMFYCSGDIQLTSTLNITGSMTIEGPGQNVILDGHQQVGVFQVNSGANLTLNLLGISNGIGVYNSNYASNVGGGIYNDGTLTVSNSALRNNSAPSGGGLFNDYGGTATITNSTLNNNSAVYSGGGIINYGTMSITNSTLSSNQVDIGAQYIGGGGGIYNNWMLTISNSTLSGNVVIDSGGGGGIFNGQELMMNISGSIVAENSAPYGNDCYGPAVTDKGYNLESGTDCGFTGTGSLQNANPMLSPLYYNGGSVETMALQQGSPAIDAIPLSANICPSEDERGLDRPDDYPSETACDMGAYESNWIASDDDLALTNMPTNITTRATSPSGAVVTYTAPTVVDEDNPLPPVNCSPATGSTFAIGKTTVTCTVTDSDDSNSPVSQNFTVMVKPVLTLSVPKTLKTNEGAVFNGTVAKGVAYGTVNPLTATVNWGDGSNAEVISVTPAADGSYSVSASHSYAEEGSYSLSVTVADQSKLSATRTGTFKVADAALKISKISSTINGLTLTQKAIFTDADPNGTLTDYSASINWGDNTATQATVGTGSGSSFTTQGSHTYANHGTYVVTLTITDSGGRTVSKTITLTV